MDVKACLEDQIGRLVHPTACAGPESASHRRFMATRLAVASGGLALIPLYLVTGGVPGWAEALLPIWFILPAYAVAHVSRTGALTQGEALSLSAWIGLAATVAFGHLLSIGPAVALLLIVPLEGCRAGPIVAKRANAVALATSAALLAGTAAGLVRATPTAADWLVYGIVAFYACVMSGLGTEAETGTDVHETAGAHGDPALADVTGDVVIRCDRAGTVLSTGACRPQSPGLTSIDLSGRGLFGRVHVGDRPTFLKLVSDAAAGDTVLAASMRLRVSAGPGDATPFAEPTFVWIEIRARREGVASGSRDTIVLAVLRDISERVAHDAAVEQAVQNAVESSAGKDRFLATVSHELRTPLNAIIGFGEILASEAHAPQDGQRRREYAEIIHTSGQHLLSVVNSLLDMSKIEAGMVELKLETIDVAALINACCDMMRLKAEGSRIDLVRDFDGALPALTCDKRACKQIVINLLSNALKFTPEYGAVTVSAHGDGATLTIVVADTGIGMVTPDMMRLGDPFFQAQNSYDRRFEGTGLGLSVVSGLVGLHGGTITVESAPGEGTRMTVRLPRRAPLMPPQPVKAKIEVLPFRARPAQAAAAPTSRKVQNIA